jgi:hypothetical protein
MRQTKATSLGRFCAVTMIATLLTAMIAVAAPPPPPGPPAANDGVAGFALQWFKQLQAGTIDRSRYTAAYSARLTDDAVREMSHQLNRYGASPTGARVLKERALANQTLYAVKVLFPRGDAASLLVGFDKKGKITGIALTSLAGD